MDPSAYDQFLEAQFLHNRRSPGDLALAEERYRKALAIDADYGAAWAGLGGTLLVRIVEGEVDPAAALEEMRVSVLRALELDPQLPEAQLRAAHYYAHAGDWEKAAQHYDRAQALGPNSAVVLSASAARAGMQGRYGEAVTLMERAVELDPLGSIARGNFVGSLANVGRYEDALRESRRARELNPGKFRDAPAEAQMLVLLRRYEEALAAAQALPEGALRDQALALAYHGLGREADARAAFGRVASDDYPQRSLLLAELHAQWGEPDAAFALLPAMRAELDASARTPGNVGRVGWFIRRPLLRPLHTDPRWEKLLAEAQWASPYVNEP